MHPIVTIVDYGRSNLLSVQRALEYCGATVEYASTPDQVAAAGALVLPGVGAFADGMNLLRESGLARAVCTRARQGIPLLGICLGMQFLFDSSSVLGSTFWSVLVWTLVWAVFATFTNYIFGMLLALLINRKDTRAKGFWRFCFVLSSAVPMFVSLLIMRTMLQPNGAVNVLLRNLGLIAPDASLPFFTDPTWARVTVIVINIWVGVPYTLMQLTGILQNIPGDLYEAAKVDGAGPVRTFFSITLPYMLYVTTPYLIATFTGNVNNFNVIYLLSGGDPITNLSSTAGSTDLLVTWLYKLTIDKQYYNVGAVVGILTFIILAVGSLLTYRRSKSYREEGGF